MIDIYEMLLQAQIPAIFSDDIFDQLINTALGGTAEKRRKIAVDKKGKALVDGRVLFLI